MTDPVSWLQIEKGWNVVGADGVLVGKVVEVTGDKHDDIFDGLAVKSVQSGRVRYVPGEQVAAIFPGEVTLKIVAAETDTLERFHEPPPSTTILPQKAPLGVRVSSWEENARRSLVMLSDRQTEMAADRVALLFDIDGTLISTGGAGAASWRLAFDELYAIPADIGKFSDAGMTDPEVGRRTFVAVIGHPPSRKEFSRLMERRLHYLFGTVADSKDYRVLAGVDKLLPRLIEQGYLLGLVTGNVEAAAHIKLHRARLNRFFSFGGYGSDSNDRAELTRLALERAALVYGEPIDPKQCLTVGDTPRDVTAAHGAGIDCVGVASGHFSVEQLREAGADFVIGSLEDGLPI